MSKTKSIKACDVCDKSYSSKLLAQCLECSQDGTIFVCDQCQADHEHHQNATSSVRQDSLNSDKIVEEFSRITNINLKQAKELWTTNGMKLVEKNSTVGKIIVEYFNNSNVTDKKCQVENIWSVKRKCVDKKFTKMDYDKSKTILLWSERINRNNFPVFLTNGFKIFKNGIKYKLWSPITFTDRISEQNLSSATTAKHDQDQDGILVLYQVCTDQMGIHGVYEQESDHNYYRTFYYHGMYKMLGLNVPDPSVTRFIGKTKVPIGKTVPSFKCNKPWWDYNRYSVIASHYESRIKLKYIVHYNEI